MAELVHCNSCGGSFRYDRPPRRGEMHDGGDGRGMRCRRCWRDVDSPPPRAPLPAHVQQPVGRSVADFAALMAREVAAGHRYYDRRDLAVETGWKVSVGDYKIEGLSIGEERRRG